MSIRKDKISKMIKEEVSLLFLQKIQDPRFGLITITNVVVTSDLKLAKVYISVFDKAMRESTIKKINDIKGLIRSELASKLNLRFMPEMEFYLDETLDYVEKMEGLFKKIHKDDNEAPK